MKKRKMNNVSYNAIKHCHELSDYFPEEDEKKEKEKVKK